MLHKNLEPLLPLGTRLQDDLLLILDLLPLPPEELIKTHEAADLDASALLREFLVVALPLRHLLQEPALAGARLVQTAHRLGKGDLCLLLLHACNLEKGFQLKTKFFHVLSSAGAGAGSDFPTAARSCCSVSS